MKKLTTTAVMICLLTLSAIAQKRNYTISANIRNLPDGITFYLILNKDGGGADTISHMKSKGQKFVFKGTLAEEGRLAFVKMDTSAIKLPDGKQSWTRLLLDHSDITLTGDFNQWPEATAKGSVPTQEYDKISLALKPLKEQYKTKLIEAQGDNSKKDQLYQAYNLEYVKILQSIPGSYALPLLIRSNSAFELEDLEREYAKLPEILKKSYYGKQLQQKIISTKGAKSIAIGKVIPDFQVKTPEGKLESVRKLALKNKYTLIDFWASWCAPCRADIPNMKKVYDAFHKKGFNILSVSTDSSLPSWQKALKEENTPWINGIDEERASSNIFGIIGIPAYMLLNEKGEILIMDMSSSFFSRSSIGTINGAPMIIKDGKGLRGDDLYQVIEGLLGKSGK